MKNLPNIEKSNFRKGEYVGYGGAMFFRISKINSAAGKWYAHSTTGENKQLFAFTLEKMSEYLAKI